MYSKYAPPASRLPQSQRPRPPLFPLRLRRQLQLRTPLYQTFSSARMVLYTMIIMHTPHAYSQRYDTRLYALTFTSAGTNWAQYMPAPHAWTPDNLSTKLASKLQFINHAFAYFCPGIDDLPFVPFWGKTKCSLANPVRLHRLC
jgi:hypothetical protein